MEFITVAEAKAAYYSDAKETTEEQLDKLNQIIRSVMKQQSYVALSSALPDDEELIQKAPRSILEEILETRELYPGFKGLNRETRDSLINDGGFKVKKRRKTYHVGDIYVGITTDIISWC